MKSHYCIYGMPATPASHLVKAYLKKFSREHVHENQPELHSRYNNEHLFSNILQTVSINRGPNIC